MYSRVNLSIFQLTSFGRPLSPNNKVASKLHLKDQYIQMVEVMQKLRREGFDVEPQNEGQRNKKCSVLSIPSLEEHIGFMVSRKLCLNL